MKKSQAVRRSPARVSATHRSRASRAERWEFATEAAGIGLGGALLLALWVLAAAFDPTPSPVPGEGVGQESAVEQQPLRELIDGDRRREQIDKIVRGE